MALPLMVDLICVGIGIMGLLQWSVIGCKKCADGAGRPLCGKCNGGAWCRSCGAYPPRGR